MELLIPDWPELAGWCGVFAASLVFIGLGRLLSGGRATPEAALIAGWGATCLVLTLWGLGRLGLALPAVVLALAGVAGLLLPTSRLRRNDWRDVARLIGVSVPLLAVMASARPSLPDTFLNLLPNAAYLFDHGVFPADSAPPSHSLLPGAPYNLQLAAFMAALITRHFPMSAMIDLNIVLQLAFALFLARLVARTEDDAAAVPSWSASAVGLLLATAFSPGFVPRYDLSAYSEAAVMVSVAFSGWFATSALSRLSAGRAANAELRLLALSLSALVNIKQDSVALDAAVVASALALTLAQERQTRGRSMAALMVASLPAALLYLAWRWYVLGHFAVGELKLLPVDQWQFALVPQILLSMVRTAAAKPYLFVALAAALAALGSRWRRRGLDPATRLTAIMAGTALVYNAALFFTYVAHFDNEIGASAHSYFRYNTHLGLLLTASLVLLGRDLVAERRWSPAQRRLGGGLAIGLAAVLPVLAFDLLRFDLEPPLQRAWQMAAAARASLDSDPRLALLLPSDGGGLATTLEGLIRFTPPRHVDAEVRAFATLDDDALSRIAAAGFRSTLISCVPPGFAGVPAGMGALLVREADGWRVASSWSYAQPRRRWRWWHAGPEVPACR